MPIYQLRCQDCEYEFETICRFDERDSCVCEECGGPTDSVITGDHGIPVGAVWDKKITQFSKQIGRSFDTNAEARQYFRENPGWVPISKDDKLMKDRRDFHLNGADATARKSGYRDHEHKMREIKKEKTRKKQLEG